MSVERCVIASWNINSIRLRMPLVAQYAKERAPDILCFQETKCRDAEFPHSALRELGYPHIEIHGQKGYHGVAIASKRPLSAPARRDFCQKGDARHLTVDVQVGARAIGLHNFYVPAGGDEPDPEINPKFAHKLAFLDEMAEWSRQERKTGRDLIVVGDLNVAPHEHDVWSHKALLSVVSHTPIEVEKMKAILEAGAWVDAMRKFIPLEEKLYSWWSYRSPDWRKADKGRRLDHIWVSAPLDDAIADFEVFKEARGWERPSDHAPISIAVTG